MSSDISFFYKKKKIYYFFFSWNFKSALFSYSLKVPYNTFLLKNSNTELPFFFFFEFSLLFFLFHFKKKIITENYHDSVFGGRLDLLDYTLSFRFIFNYENFISFFYFFSFFGNVSNFFFFYTPRTYFNRCIKTSKNFFCFFCYDVFFKFFLKKIFPFVVLLDDLKVKFYFFFSLKNNFFLSYVFIIFFTPLFIT